LTAPSDIGGVVEKTRSLLVLVLALGATLVIPTDGSAGGTNVKRANETSGGVQSSDSVSFSHLSHNGRYVMFDTNESLVPRDDNLGGDVYVKDLKTQKLKLVSVRSNGNVGNDSSVGADISKTGRYIVFFSYADNLVRHDDNGKQDVFVHDRTTKKTTRVSVRSNGNEGDGDSALGAISADGRFVAFRTNSALVGSDDPLDDLHPDIYLHDRNTGRTRLVSKLPSGDAAGDTNSPDISYDGGFVLFTSGSAIAPGGDPDSTDAFRWRRSTGQSKIVSVSSSETPGNGFFGAEGARISGDGKHVLFMTDASNMVGGDAGDDHDLFVRNVPAGTTRRATLGNGGVEPNSDSQLDIGDISANGRWVTFSLFASNLISEDNNSKTDVFVRDMGTLRTRRVSLTVDGGESNGVCVNPRISGDGKHVVFLTTATNFLREDLNGTDYDAIRIGPIR
jgi:Tol biopolymer transport system component